MISFTLFLLAISGLLISKRILGDYFSPPAIYNFFWTFSLGALSLDWVAFDPMGDQVWLTIGISYAAFMGGAAIVLLYAFGKTYWLNAPPSLVFVDRKKLERCLAVLFVLGVFGFVVQLAHLQLQVGLGTFLSSPGEARELHTNVKYVGFFNLLNVANFGLALMYLCLYKKPARWVLLIMLWAVATTFITTDRTRFFYMVIWSFYVVVYLYRHIRLNPRLIAVAVCTFSLLLGFFLLIAKVYKKQAFDDNMEFVKVGEELAPLVDPYIYLTGSYPVLQAFLEDKHQHTQGKYTFGPIVKVIELFYPELQRAELVGKFYRVPIELNACTYLEPFYKDFGVAGVVLGPLFLGFLTTLVYVWMRQRKTIFSVYTASLLSFCVTISIFVNHFTQIATWYFVVVGYLVYRYCQGQEETDRAEMRNFLFD